MNLLTTCVALVIACTCLSACSSQRADDPPQGLDFDELPRPADVALPERETYTARDGARLHYRKYSANSRTWLILIHGSATDSVYLYPLAQSLAESAAANVITPDLRGHGPSPDVRGDIDYIDQLEDDLADLIAHLRDRAARGGEIVVGGHSSGAGLALRFGGSVYGDRAAGYLLLAPYLGHDAPTTRSHSGGWAQPNLTRIIPIAMANTAGIRWFNGVGVLRFNMPPAQRTGRETLSYSYRLMKGFGPADYASDFAAIDAPVLLLAGSDDEAFRSRRYKPAIEPHNAAVDVDIVQGASHLGLVASDEAAERAAHWLAEPGSLNDDEEDSRR
ncbi:alpha/beta hydrolase [Salinisphaera sp.]|uniref:alpha/beta hydrolase n=1 Tax=Salinisphaera sp. TaxID=1914330 RepID=UPI0025D45ECF|nr:alpha/beta hydrolase [Salinisphaera sp.]